MVFEIRKFEFPLPSLGEIKQARRMAQINPEELDDRDLWILQEFTENTDSQRDYYE